jgi:hypothetical protein
MKKHTAILLTLLLTGCGMVTSQSVYEGFRTQQSVRDAGAPPTPADSMGSYDAYEKERQKLKSQE